MLRGDYWGGVRDHVVRLPCDMRGVSTARTATALKRTEEFEILVLGHELVIARRQLGRPQPSAADRALLAARASTVWAAAPSRCPNPA